MTEVTHYLSGPMTGYEKFNFPAFEQAARYLRNQLGLKIISAHEIDHGIHTGTGTQPHVEYLRGDIRELLACDSIILLPGWPASKGARTELDVALSLEYQVYFFTQDKELIRMG